MEKVFGDNVREQKLRRRAIRAEPKESSDATLMALGGVRGVSGDQAGEVSDHEIEKPALTVGDAEVQTRSLAAASSVLTYAEAAGAAADGDRAIIDSYRLPQRRAVPGVARPPTSLMLVGGGQMLPDFEKAVLGVAGRCDQDLDMTSEGLPGQGIWLARR